MENDYPTINENTPLIRIRDCDTCRGPKRLTGNTAWMIEPCVKHDHMMVEDLKL